MDFPHQKKKKKPTQYVYKVATNHSAICVFRDHPGLETCRNMVHYSLPPRSPTSFFPPILKHFLRTPMQAIYHILWRVLDYLLLQRGVILLGSHPWSTVFILPHNFGLLHFEVMTIIEPSLSTNSCSCVELSNRCTRKWKLRRQGWLHGKIIIDSPVRLSMYAE